MEQFNSYEDLKQRCAERGYDVTRLSMLALALRQMIVKYRYNKKGERNAHLTCHKAKTKHRHRNEHFRNNF